MIIWTNKSPHSWCIPCLEYELASIKWLCLMQFFVFNLQRMAAGVYNQPIVAFQSHSHINNFNHQQKFNNLVRLVTKDFIGSNFLSRRDCRVIQSLASQTSVVDTVSSPSKSKTSDRDTHKKSSKENSSLSWHSLLHDMFVCQTLFMWIAS